GLAEVEKERARLAVRSVVGNPATDFAALDAEGFFAALRCACQEGLVSAGLVAEAGRRIADGVAGSRELHQVLFAAGDGGGWEEVRRAALATVAGQPHLAVEVVSLQAQRLGVRRVGGGGTAGEGGFTGWASLDRDGVTVQGQPCFDTSKKRASQRAVVSLLAMLVGIALPAVGGPVGDCGPRAGSPPV